MELQSRNAGTGSGEGYTNNAAPKQLYNWFNLDEECIVIAVNCLKSLLDLFSVNTQQHIKLVCVNIKTYALYSDLKNVFSLVWHFFFKVW